MSKRIYVVDEETVEAYPHIFTIGLTVLSDQIYELDNDGLVVLKHREKVLNVDDYRYKADQLVSFIGDDIDDEVE